MVHPKFGILIGITGWFMAGMYSTGQAQTWKPGPPMKAEVEADGIQRMRIVLDSYSYTPNHVIVEAGKPVELLLTSVTTLTPHNFVIQDPAGGASIEQDIGAGKSVAIRFTPSQPGRVSFFCDKRLWPMASHRDKGMEGMLDIQSAP